MSLLTKLICVATVMFVRNYGFSATVLKPAANPVKPESDDSAELKDTAECKKVYKRFALPWKAVWAKHAINLKSEDTNGLAFIEDMTPAHCDDPETKKELLALLSRILNQHSGRIAVLLPLSTKPHARYVLKGIEQFIKANGGDPTKVVLALDTKSKTNRTEQLLAEALFKHQVSAVMGGFESADVALLKDLGAKILVPIFILNKPPIDHKPKPFVFYTHPTTVGLAKAMVSANERYRHKKISILRPSDQHSDNLARDYEKLAKESGINVLHNVVYDGRRVDQMENSARKLFKLEPNDRLDELKQLYETAKSQAKLTGEAFNSKMVALQPVVEQDAIMILDHFRAVRHMAKIFSFLGVRRIPMFGHYEWRSSGLVQPFDPVFVGSYFVDVVGPYSTLPQGLQVPTTPASPNFISPDKIEEVDFSMIGYRAVEVPYLLSKAKQVQRRKMDVLIPRADVNRPLELEFNQDNVISWPTYLFEVIVQGKTGTILLR